MAELSHGHAGTVTAHGKFGPAFGNGIADRLFLFRKERKDLIRRS
jgi:hypothetical protein